MLTEIFYWTILWKEIKGIKNNIWYIYRD